MENENQTNQQPNVQNVILMQSGGMNIKSTSLTNWSNAARPISTQPGVDWSRSVVGIAPRTGQILTGPYSLVASLALFFATCKLFEVYQPLSGAMSFDRFFLIAGCCFPALLGLVCARTAGQSFQHYLKTRQHLSSREFCAEQFPDSNRRATNLSQQYSKKLVRNFLIGQVVFAAILIPGCKWVSEDLYARSGPAFMLGVLILWSAVALFVTIRQVRLDATTESLHVDFDSCPLELGQRIRLNLSLSDSFEEVRLERVQLLCLADEIVSLSGNNVRGTTSRRAVQLYCDTRDFDPLKRQPKQIELVFELPPNPELSTDLWKFEPLYWCLTVDGYISGEPLEGQFLLPIYKAH